MYLFFALTVHLTPRGLFFALINKKPAALQRLFPVAAENESGRQLSRLIAAAAGGAGSLALSFGQVTTAGGDRSGCTSNPAPCLTHSSGSPRPPLAPGNGVRARL